jgi:leader peptidase (prepilin peptidase)/N-methyltransferase
MASVLPAWLLHPATLALIGLAIGSFLNVVIYRLPSMLERDWWRDVRHQLADEQSYRRVFGSTLPEPLQRSATALQGAIDTLPALSLARPASRCPSCGHRIRAYENVPLVSWLLLRGRCSSCRARISIRYPAIELLCAALFAAIGWRMGGTQPQILLWCGFAAALLALAWIDWDTTVLPDAITLPLLWAGLLIATLGWTIDPVTALVGAAAGYLSLWAVYWFFKLATGKEGMGYGDFGCWRTGGVVGLASAVADRSGRIGDRRHRGHRDEAVRRAPRRSICPFRSFLGRRRLGSHVGWHARHAGVDGLGLTGRVEAWRFVASASPVASAAAKAPWLPSWWRRAPPSSTPMPLHDR